MYILERPKMIKYDIALMLTNLTRIVYYNLELLGYYKILDFLNLNKNCTYD